MCYSRAFIPTLKQAPADARSVSHVLLLRAGYARRIGARIYSYPLLGLRLLRKIERACVRKLEALGLEVQRARFLPLDEAARITLELVQQALRASAAGEAA